jgi:uncharacterized membrane protein
MPYEWLKNPERAAERSAALSASAPHEPHARLALWPYRSLTPRGFVTFIGITCAMLGIPLVALLGSKALWGLLPFMALAVGGVWIALNRSNHDGDIAEDLSLWPDRAILRHRAPDGTEQRWEANPYWVSVHLHETGGPVPNYLTLRGGDREVEIGRFLSEDERIVLARELAGALAGLRARP